MFTRRKDDEDGYRLTTRFWAIVVVAVVLFGYIGWKTQDTADRVEQVQADTRSCLNQVIATLKERVTYNDQVSELRARRDDVWMAMIAELARIDISQPQAQRDAAAKPVLDKFFASNAALDQERADVLAARNETPYPDEDCGKALP